MLIIRELPHPGLFKNYRACPQCGGLFTVDVDTKYRQALCLVVALISLVFTLFLYYEDTTRWLAPAVASYVALGLLIFWGNRKVFFVPYDKAQEPTESTRMSTERSAVMPLIKKLFIFFGTLLLLFVAAGLFMFWGFWESSGYSNCVIVAEESHFIGERMKYSRAVSHGRTPDQACIDEDLKRDGGDGPLRGTVRWAECFKGPDCDEAGMF